jgi:SynChlorMet cassette radical SAM/SPASM protein ScmE
MSKGIPFPTAMSVSVTGRCNLKCQYCFYADEMTALSDLPTEAWLKCFQELTAMGVRNVTLTGGEALTRRDFWELVDGVIANHMRYDMLSNGTLFTEKVIEQFNVGKRRIRLNSIQISIDGSTAEIHNMSRPNSFERAMRGLRLLKAAGFPLTVRVTINRHNYKDLENIAHLLLEDVGLPSFSTNEAVPLGSGCNNMGTMVLTSAEKLETMRIFKRLEERYGNRISALAGPLAKLKMYAEMDHARETGEKSTRWQMGYLTACGCVFSKLDILHDGSIVPCNMLGSLVLGNIQTDSIEEIWRSHPVLQAMKARRAIPLSQVPGCEDCEWNEYCNGSCPSIAYDHYGDMNRGNPEDCYRRFLNETADRYIPLEQLLVLDQEQIS